MRLNANALHRKQLSLQLVRNNETLLITKFTYWGNRKSTQQQWNPIGWPKSAYFKTITGTFSLKQNETAEILEDYQKYLKSKVASAVLDQLKRNIRVESIVLPSDIFEKVIEIATKRANFAVSNNDNQLLAVKLYKNTLNAFQHKRCRTLYISCFSVDLRNSRIDFRSIIILHIDIDVKNTENEDFSVHM